jgi:hypothetical protein
MYNLTIPLDPNTIDEVVAALSALPFPIAPRINMELQELTVLCEVSHAADVERTLAPYV